MVSEIRNDDNPFKSDMPAEKTFNPKDSMVQDDAATMAMKKKKAGWKRI